MDHPFFTKKDSSLARRTEAIEVWRLLEMPIVLLGFARGSGENDGQALHKHTGNTLDLSLA